MIIECNFKYRIAGKFGKFGESSMIRQINLVLTIDNLLADVLIRQTFFHQMFEKSLFAKFSPCQKIPLYGSYDIQEIIIIE